MGGSEEKNVQQARQLIDAARKAGEKAYAPYSGYHVGAAVLTDTGELFTGCNIENASYGLTNCAERTAIFKAISSGARKITAIAVAGPAGGAPAYPCGACRQVIAEFAASPEMPIYVGLGDKKGDEPEATDRDYEIYTLAELLPKGFSL